MIGRQRLAVHLGGEEGVRELLGGEDPAGALDRALALTARLGLADERLELLDRAIAQSRSPSQRAMRLAERGELTPGDFKELTGLSRRGAIPLLEWLDAQKVTRRQGDVRVSHG